MTRQKRLFSNTFIAFCAIAIGVFAYWLQISFAPDSSSAVQSMELSKPLPPTPKDRPTNIVSGVPERITIANRNIDVPIKNGGYDRKTGTWILSDTHAKFATATMPPNDQKGMTFIYGHGTDDIFGRIGSDPPPAGTIATLHTREDQTFIYSLESVQNSQPSDTSIFRNANKGTPRLVLQTCTGLFSEWRTMFIFALKNVRTAKT